MTVNGQANVGQLDSRGTGASQMPLDFGDPKLTALTFVQTRPDLFRPEFLGWLKDNWPVWVAFRAQADRIWQRGRKHYSARTIVEWLRHETLAAERGGDFKLNGNYVPDLARLYNCYHPEREGFFEFRVMPLSTRRAA